MARILEEGKITESLAQYDSSAGEGIKRTPLPVMAKSLYAKGEWSELMISPYQAISLSPAARIFHYGQSVFEGQKAFVHRPEGNIRAFRAGDHYNRFCRSCETLVMPVLPKGLYLEAITSFLELVKGCVPYGKGKSLYLRPIMFASASNIDIDPSDEYMFILIGLPFEGVFGGRPLDVYVEEGYPRAFPGGTGSAKAAGNYAAGLRAHQTAKALDCQQTLWLDAREGTYIEELSGMNFFVVVGSALHTPRLTDTILAGITRDSIIYMARHLGMEVCEKDMPFTDLLREIDRGRCLECFATGTAAGVLPIRSFRRSKGEVTALPEAPGPVTQKLKDYLLSYQAGLIPGDPLNYFV